jgi:hypothetical protein
MPAAIDLDARSPWMSQRKACGLLGRSPAVLLRLAAIGTVKTLAVPGQALRYSRKDVEQLARDHPGPVEKTRGGKARYATQ